MLSSKLNDYLLPLDSPIVQNQGQISAYRFDYENEAGVISTSKIRLASIGSAQIGSAQIGSGNISTLSFNQISGGTATLGGAGNGDGLLTLRNSGGTEVVRLDNQGITITAGSISNVTVTSGTITTGTINDSIIGSPTITGGTANSLVMGTPSVTGGTFSSPTITGTSIFSVNAGSAALGINGNFAIQTHTGSAVLVARVAGVTYFFTCAGTL